VALFFVGYYIVLGARYALIASAGMGVLLKTRPIVRGGA
jgi:hypothetical protein